MKQALKKCRFQLVLSVFVAFITFSDSHATFINDSDTSPLASPDVSIDFGSGLFDFFTVIDDEFVSQGITFGGNWQYSTTTATSPSLSAGYLFHSSTAQPPGSFLFTESVTDVVFSWRSDPGFTTFTTYLDGTQVETETALTNLFLDTGRFYGFTGSLFDEIRFSYPSDILRPTLDNLQFNLSGSAPVQAPLPGTFSLLCAGLGAFVLSAWRRRYADVYIAR